MFNKNITSNKKIIKQANKNTAELKYSVHNSKDIHKIKNQIQTILKRHNTPLPLILLDKYKNLISQKSTTLEVSEGPLKKKYKSVYQDEQDQIAEKKEKYRKFLFTEFFGNQKSQQKSFGLKKKNPYIMQQKQYLKQSNLIKKVEKQFHSSKFNFDFSQLQQKRSDQLEIGTGKILFYSQSKVKMKRDRLINCMTDKKKNQHLEPVIDNKENSFLNKYLSTFKGPLYQKDKNYKAINWKQNGEDVIESSSSRFGKNNKKRSSDYTEQSQYYEIESARSVLQKNLIETSSKQQKQSASKLTKRNSYAFEVEERNKKKPLNAIDGELLVYYKRINNKKGINSMISTKYPILSSKNASHLKKRNSLILDSKKPGQKVNQPLKITKQTPQWKLQTFDPWERIRIETELDNLGIQIQTQI